MVQRRSRRERRDSQRATADDPECHCGWPLPLVKVIFPPGWAPQTVSLEITCPICGCVATTETKDVLPIADEVDASYGH